jgi:hypothetical protein
MRKIGGAGCADGFVTQNFLEEMALIQCVAAQASILCRLLYQPQVVGYLIAGIAVGPHVPGVCANMGQVQLVSDLGVTLLIFSIGLEFRFRRLKGLAPTTGLIALIQVAAMIGLGYLVGRRTGWTPWESLLTGAVVSISGAVSMAKTFEEAKVYSRVRELVPVTASSWKLRTRSDLFKVPSHPWGWLPSSRCFRSAPIRACGCALSRSGCSRHSAKTIRC